MGFNIFDEQLNTRRQNDQQMFEEAFSDLISVLGVKTGAAKESAKAAKGEFEKILRCFGAEIPKIPESISGFEAQMEAMRQLSGIICRRIELKGEWWKDAQGPMLGNTANGGVIAILPGRFFGYRYSDPETGREVKINKKTAAGIESGAFGFYRPLPARKLKLWDLALFAFKSLSKSDIFFTLLISLIIALLGLFLPFMNNQIFNSVIPSGIKGNILPVAVLLMGAAFGTTFFHITRSLMLNRFQNKISLVQVAAMMRVFKLPAAFFKDYSSGELSSRFSSIQSLISMLSNGVLTAGLSALFSFVYIFQMANYTPSLVVPGICVILAMLLLSLVITFLQLKVSRKILKLSAKLSGLSYALFSGVQKIKLSGAEKRAFAKWAGEYKEEGKLAYSPPYLLRIHPALTVLISMAGMLVLYYIAGITGVTPADYISFTVAYGAVSGAILGIGSMAGSVANIKPMMEMAQPILDAIPENSGNKKIVTSVSGNFEVNNVTFAYSEDGPKILNNLSLKVKRGEYVAIVGKTGCGKSTLMRLLLGFEKPLSGAIYYDGQDMEKLDLTSLRQCLGVCLQNGKLFAGDIYSNIMITAPLKTMDDAWEAARLAGIDEDIKAMPMGMHTVISEGSGGVSGGQRQRLLIARALVSGPKILFFDEATSALDNITQKYVADSLASLKCTRVVIAHRLSTIRHCDRILVLNGGAVAEEGNYDTLIAKKGIFYELSKRQIL